MESGRVYDDDDSHMTNVLLKNDRISPNSEILDSLWVPNSSPSFHGSASMVNFKDVNNTERPFFTQIEAKSEYPNEEFEECYHHHHQPEKKRRLSPEQVQFLEKSFEVENKLEPERKVHLAKELGLQPRQVAIWFQNRRARYKTKHLEKEFDSLKANYDKLKADYDTLFKDNEKLKNEVHLLTEKLLPVPINHPSDLEQKNTTSSAKSDVLDSDSPHHYNEENHSTALLLEPEAASDCSQDEDDNFLTTSCFPKLEVEETFDDLQPNSCNLGFPVQDQGTWYWQY